MDATTCHVCTEAVTDTNSSVCNHCDRRFHLRLRNDADGPDCGDVRINEQYLALEFACFECLGVGRGLEDGAGEPPVGSAH